MYLRANPTNTEEQWTALRVERDRRLAEFDWTHLSDAPVDQASWAAYRQALRNLPETTTDPTQPQWPVSPSKQAENGT
jgi:hypothetical protein